MKKAVFVDRDGTLNAMVYNEDHGLMDSPMKPEQVRMIPGAGEFLAELHKDGFFVCVATNQPGLAKGTLTLKSLDAVNQSLAQQLSAEGGHWDDFTVCPHHPKGSGVQNEFVRECRCRKPKPGLLLDAAKTHNIDLSASWMVGDGLNDIQAGRAAGCKTILVTSLKIEQIQQFFQLDNCMPDAIVPKLQDALPIIRKTN
jgi:D-glycero-D-manno-heptose 1,7-bisphosphate phosphatase